MKPTANKADDNGLTSAERILREAAIAASAASAKSANGDVEERRSGSVMDQRMGLDRRDMGEFLERRRAGDADATDEGDGDGEVSGKRKGSGAKNCNTNLERRRGPGRRRTDFMKAADEGEMSQEQFLFIMAIDAFKRVNGKTFPTWTDVLEVIRKLGYRKTQPSELENLGANTEDWTERADAPAGVFKPADEDDEV